MSFTKLALVCIALVSVLSGCEKPAPPLSAVQGVQKIGIVSALGDELHFQRMGFTVFTNAKDKANIANWGLRKSIEERAKTRLDGRYSVERVNVDVAALDPGDVTVEKIAQLDKANRADAPLDAYIIFMPKRGSVDLSGFNFVPIEGLTIFQKDIPFVMTTWVCTAADVVLVDGRHLQELRRVPLELNLGMMMREVDGVMTDRTARLVDDEGDWPGNLSSLSEAQVGKLKASYVSLLGAQIDDALVHIGLAQ